MGLIEGIAGAGMGMMLGESNDRRQIQQQKKLQAMQIKGNKEMADYQQSLQYDMWNKTNYEAQKEHMKAAGLNPALMYGMGGGGGTTTGSGGGAGVTGATATDPSSAVQAATGMGMMLAQQGLIEAQTKKTNIEAEKIAGVDTEKTTTEIASLTQGIENAKAVKELTEVQTRLANINEYVAGESQESAIDYIAYQAKKAEEEVTAIGYENRINGATIEEKRSIIKEQAIGAVLQNTLLRSQNAKTRSDIQVNHAQINKMAADITNAIRGLDQKDTEIKIHKFVEEFKANNPSLLNVGGGVIEQLQGNIYKILGIKRNMPNEIK